MNIQEKAEQYALEKLGNWCHITHSAYVAGQCTNGEISAQDFTAGYNEAKRWIPVGERLPDCYMSGSWDGLMSDEILVKLKDGRFDIAVCYYGFMDGSNFCAFYDSREFEIENIIEWREI